MLAESFSAASRTFSVTSARRASTINAAAPIPWLLAPMPASMSRVTPSRSAALALMPLVEPLIWSAAVRVDRSVARMLPRLRPMPVTDPLISAAVSRAATTLSWMAAELPSMVVEPARIEST